MSTEPREQPDLSPSTIYLLNPVMKYFQSRHQKKKKKVKKVKKPSRANDNEQESGSSVNRAGNSVDVSNRFSGRRGLGKPER